MTSLLASMAVGVALELLKPWPVKILVDHVLGDVPLPHALRTIFETLPGPATTDALLVAVCVTAVLIYVAAALMNVLTTATSVRLGQRMTFDLGADLFLHLQKLSLVFHSRLKVGDTVARVTVDPRCVQVVVTGLFVPFLQAAGTLTLMAFIMWQLDPGMTLIALGVAPFLAIAMRAFAAPMKSRHRVTRDLEGQMMSMVEQTLSAMPVVQAFTREEREHARYRAVADRTIEAHVRAASADMWFKVCVGAVTATGTAAIMYLGGRYVLDGDLSVGTMLVFLSYLTSLYVPLNTLTYMASEYQYAAANADRVMEILQTTPDVQDAAGAIAVPLRGDISFEQVGFGYDRSTPVLRDVSFRAVPGETVALVGATGAGKTTLINLLLRFADPQAGRITIDGHDLRTLQVRSLREQISIVLQDPFIFPQSIADNIAYGRVEASRREIEEAARAARADEFIRRLPDGYDTVVGERGATLSGGEKQRLSIARAFLKQAPILILDEPTSALDARTESQLLDALDDLMRDRVTLVIAHRLTTIRNAHQILVLQGGRIVERGRHEELLEGGGLYATYYRAGLARNGPRPPARVSRSGGRRPRTTALRAETRGGSR
jgi:ATP-binding cassette, subfamily B, bacterial